ncbi:MAG: hypothetical protein KME08_19670 [Aphanothece sp. CMT-3BRIN-NPC111]|jgi:hypothetical protein|nr:hypothetical protein [Aphanothece sp. CMT-3BRIN-NPC111]
MIIWLLGILKYAAIFRLVDLETTFVRLREVGFWVAPCLVEKLLKED